MSNCFIKRSNICKAIIMTLSIIMSICNTNVEASSRMKISKNIITMTVGDTTKLKITGNNGKQVTWSSNKRSVAIVNQNGKVTGKGVGTAKITAKVSNKSFICTVKVSKKHLYEMDIFNSATWHNTYSKWTSYSDALGNYYPNSIIITFDGANNEQNNSLEYYLGKKYNTLSGKVAFRKENIKEAGQLQLVVYGDDVEIYRSGVFDERTEPEGFSINVKGISFLKFSAEIISGTAGNDSWYNDLILVDPVLK